MVVTPDKGLILPRIPERTTTSREDAFAEADALKVRYSEIAIRPMYDAFMAALAPQSLAAEQYRSLRTRISSAENGRANRAIIVTSPGKGDGKSLTAANLALTMAQDFHRRICVVDANLRHPQLHHLRYSA